MRAPPDAEKMIDRTVLFHRALDQSRDFLATPNPSSHR
jgi:hypothetical protein